MHSPGRPSEVRYRGEISPTIRYAIGNPSVGAVKRKRGSQI